MSDRTSLTLTPERRRLEDRARDELGDALPDHQFRTTLYDMALQNLLETIQNHREYEGDPRKAKAFGTSVVRPRYRTHVEIERP